MAVLLGEMKMKIDFEPCKKGFNMNSSIGFICGVANAWGQEKLCRGCELKLNALMIQRDNAMRKMKTEKLFVYGTLKKGFRLHNYLGNSKLLGEDTLKGFDIYSNGTYPMIVRGESIVKGEVYEVPVSLFVSTLDLIESEYNRVKVNTENFKDVNAYVYKYPVKHLVKLKEEFKQ